MHEQQILLWDNQRLYNPNFLTPQEADKLFAFCQTLPRKRSKAPFNNANYLKRIGLGSWNDYGISAKMMRRMQKQNERKDRPTMDSAPWQIQDLAIKLSLLALKPVNYISTIGYEDETDKIDWHQHAEDRARDARVFIVSLGETRTFGLREICPQCRVCEACNFAACDGHKNECAECVTAKQHRKWCSVTNNRQNWTLFQPTHGSLITIPSDHNWTHEHAVLVDKPPKGLRISFNTKCLPTDETLDEFIARMERPSSADQRRTTAVPRLIEPKIYDCHAGCKYPADAIYVGCKVQRGGKVIRPGTIYGNGVDPLKGHYPMAAANDGEFREYAIRRMQDPVFRAQAIRELRGKYLLCWCKQDGPNRSEFCHARIWLEFINSQEYAGSAT